MSKQSLDHQGKDLSLVNCTVSGLLALVLTIPLHEFFHFATDLIYGRDVIWFSAVAVQSGDNIDLMTLSSFHRIMLAGGSASIINIIIGLVLFVIIINVSMGPMMRIFLTQYMGMHLSVGFGYFMIGGMFGGFGDWGNVLGLFDESTVVIMRIVLAVIGSIGVVFTFFALNYMSYYFIKDPGDKSERFYVALRLHLIPFIASFAFAAIVDMNSILMKEGYVDAHPMFNILVRFMLIAFFWAFMFTWVMVKPPKKSRFLYPLVMEPQVVLWVVTAILLAIDLFVLAPGIRIS